MMARSSMTIALAFAATTVPLAAGTAAAQALYDNPAKGGAPCVVLSRYVADQPTTGLAADGALRRAEAAVENICGRSVEVSLCIDFAEPIDDMTASCSVEILRPRQPSSTHRVEVPVALAGPTWQWRWLPNQANME
jgi:hypothetical protein